MTCEEFVNKYSQEKNKTTYGHVIIVCKEKQIYEEKKIEKLKMKTIAHAFQLTPAPQPASTLVLQINCGAPPLNPTSASLMPSSFI